MDLAFWLWLALIKFPFMRMVRNHYDFMLKYSKPYLSSFSWNYSWFMQYMNNDNGDLLNARPPLGMHSESFHLILVYIFYVSYYIIVWFHFFALSFVYSCLWFLFTNYVMTLVALKRRKQFLPLKFLFRDDVKLITYLTMDPPKSFKKRRN